MDSHVRDFDAIPRFRDCCRLVDPGCVTQAAA